jgi:hypothetical protein
MFAMPPLRVMFRMPLAMRMPVFMVMPVRVLFHNDPHIYSAYAVLLNTLRAQIKRQAHHLCDFRRYNSRIRAEAYQGAERHIRADARFTFEIQYP